MTEAAHQMASNPLPPRARKPGSVGIAAGPEVAIMDDDGKLLPPGEIGEVVIRGDERDRAATNNPKANAEAFTNGWFRTGDQGLLDAEAICASPGASRRSSTAAARRSRRAKSTRCCWITRPWRRW